jgi:phosphoglucosamine mutase
VVSAIAKVEKALDGRGRVLIRYSGTEPKARVMVEGEDEVRVREYAEAIAGELRRALGGEPA